jgi:hypothetical protein
MHWLYLRAIRRSINQFEGGVLVLFFVNENILDIPIISMSWLNPLFSFAPAFL